MAVQSNGKNSYTAANLFVPEALIDEFLRLEKNINIDRKSYDMAIGRWDFLLY